MRVRILGLNYLPESTSIGPYTAGLAEHLLTLGHDVHVITGFPIAPQWRIWEGYRRRLWMRETINGVKVTRTPLIVPRDPRRWLGRAIFDSSFAASAFIGGLFSGPCDVIVAVSPPLQIGVTAWLLGRLWGAPVLLHIQDLVSEAAAATGALGRDSLGLRAAVWLERFVYKRATRLGVICEAFRRVLEQGGVSRSKILMLPNYIDLDFARPGTKTGAFRKKLGIRHDEFVVMYAGSLGAKQGLETLVDAAQLIQGERHIRVVIVGEGPTLPELRTRADQLTNISFCPLQPREDLPDMLAAADLLAITQRRAVTGAVFPGKLLYYMAAGRPILAAVNDESETGRFVRSQGVGIVTPAEDPSAMAQAIKAMSGERADALGRRARAVVEQLFDRRVVLQTFGRAVEELSAIRAAGTAESRLDDNR